MEATLRRFGDEYSTLVDQYERRSFEVRLNQAILGRSLSEPAVQRCLVSKSRGRESGFRKMMKKMLGPILGKKSSPSKNAAPIPKDPSFWETYSRSLRV